MRIDRHQHFWQYNRTNYVFMSDEHAIIRRNVLPKVFFLLLQTVSLGSCIVVQARQAVIETDFLLELVAKHSFIKGVIGWIPFYDIDVEEYIDKYKEQDKIVGFRHVVHDEKDDQLILRTDFNAGIKAQIRHCMYCDLLIFERHLQQIIEFVDKYPRHRMVLDHIANPQITRNQFDHERSRNIIQVSERENVSCNLLGMVTEAENYNLDEALLKPYFETILNALGTERVIFGSDCPLCLMGSNYSKWVETVFSLIAPISSSEQASIIGCTAE